MSAKKGEALRFPLRGGKKFAVREKNIENRAQKG